jgi:hypothetical protein
MSFSNVYQMVSELVNELVDKVSDAATDEKHAANELEQKNTVNTKTTKRKRRLDREKNKAYYKKNREKILKQKRDKNKTEAGKARARQNYQNHKHKYTDGTYQSREACMKACRSRQHEVIRELLEGKTCVLCPHDTTHHLEFDHLDPTKKIKCVTAILNIEKLRAEAAKCQLLCIWCHRVKTWQEQRLLLVIYTKPEPDAEGHVCNGLLCQGQIRANEHFYHRRGKPDGYCKTCESLRRQQIRKERAEHVRDQKRNVVKKCQLCERKVEEGFEMCFDFDHINPKTKKNNISTMVCNRASQKALDAELAKCRLLCCYCHKDHTAEQMEYHYSDAKKMKMKDTTE